MFSKLLSVLLSLSISACATTRPIKRCSATYACMDPAEQEQAKLAQLRVDEDAETRSFSWGGADWGTNQPDDGGAQARAILGSIFLGFVGGWAHQYQPSRYYNTTTQHIGDHAYTSGYSGSDRVNLQTQQLGGGYSYTTGTIGSQMVQQTCQKMGDYTYCN